MKLRTDWSPSRLRSTVCQRKYFYEYGLDGHGNRRLKGNHKTQFGTMLHEALGAFDYERALGADKDTAAARALDVALHLSYGWESPSTKMNRRNLARAVVWYCDDQPEDAREGIEAALDKSGKPMIEAEASLELTGVIGGEKRFIKPRFDVIGKAGGVSVLLERKSTEHDIGPRMIERYTPDTQIDVEDLVASRQNGAFKRATLLIEAHQIGVGFSRWYRWEVERDKAQRQECLDDVVYAIQETERNMRVARNGDDFPMQRAACGLMGGCDWRPACARTPALRQEFIEESDLYELRDRKSKGDPSK